MIGMISDLHVNLNNRDGAHLKHIIDVTDEFYDLCIEKNVHKIIILGDLFDTKTSIRTEALLLITKIIKKFSKKWEVFIIVGNHDLASFIDKEQNLVDIFDGYKNITVIDKPCTYELTDNLNVTMTPYMYAEEFKKYISCLELYKDTILFGHQGLSGFSMNQYKDSENNVQQVYNEADMDASEFEFKKIFMGHYHGYQQKGKVTYVSSPLQLRHNDELADHGFVFFNENTLDHEFVPCKSTPQFATIRVTKSTLPDILKLKNHYLRLIVPAKMKRDKLISLKDKLSKANYDIKIEQEKDGIEMVAIKGWQDIQKQDAETLFDNFLDSQDEVLKEKGWKKKEMLKVIL